MRNPSKFQSVFLHPNRSNIRLSYGVSNSKSPSLEHCTVICWPTQQCPHPTPDYKCPSSAKCQKCFPIVQGSKGGGEYPFQLKIYSVFKGAFPLIRIGQLTKCQRKSIGNKSKRKDHSLIEPAALGLHINRRCLDSHLPKQSCSGPGRGCHTS